MPLKPCRECGTQVSAEAESCALCGTFSHATGNVNKKTVFALISVLFLIVLALEAVGRLSAEESGPPMANQDRRVTHNSDGTVTTESGNMTMTKRLVDWPSWMTSWSQCVDRAKSLNQMYGFSPPGLEPKYKNEVHGSSDHYHVALSFRCAHENGIRKVEINLVSFSENPPPTPPRELLDKLARDFQS
jgi:hypothetical protein